MSTTELFHLLADEGDQITALRYTAPNRRFWAASRLYLLLLLRKAKNAFNGDTKTKTDKK